MDVNAKDLYENHLALLVAIRCETSADQAFKRVDSLLKSPFMDGGKIDKGDMPFIIDMANRGALQSYIGRMYGVCTSTISYRIKRYRDQVSN